VSIKPYYQPSPASPNPFNANTQFNDPVPYSADASAWALNIRNSRDFIVFGAGLYSFFSVSVHLSSKCYVNKCPPELLRRTMWYDEKLSKANCDGRFGVIWNQYLQPLNSSDDVSIERRWQWRHK
jgi:hypothetical protein